MIYAHISIEGLAGFTTTGDPKDLVARVEGFGPRLVEELRRLLGDRDVTVTPVIDLNQVHNVNGYEHPPAVKLRTELRTVGDVFPHSTSPPETRVDHDHPTPYQPMSAGGPSGQTGDLSDAPLGRFNHRAKTHLPYQMDQLALGVYRWATPNGFGRMVTPTGTKTVTLIVDQNGRIVGEVYNLPPDDLPPDSDHRAA